MQYFDVKSLKFSWSSLYPQRPIHCVTERYTYSYIIKKSSLKIILKTIMNKLLTQEPLAIHIASYSISNQLKAYDVLHYRLLRHPVVSHC